MDIRLLGIIRSTDNEVIGFRLLDVDKQDIRDVPVNSVVEVLRNTGVRIDGLKLEDRKLVGSNGRLERYPIIVNKQLKGKSPLIVVSQFDNRGVTIGYRVCDWKGYIADISVESAVKYADENGISNGAVRTIGNKKIISSIRGEYNRLEAEDIMGKQKIDKPDIFEIIEDDICKGWLSEIIGVCMGGSRVDIIGQSMRITSVVSPNDDSLNSIGLLVIPKEVSAINSDILNNMGYLKRIVVQEGVESLIFEGDNEVRNYSVESIALPSTLRVVKGGFSGLYNVDEINIQDTRLETCVKCFNHFKIITLILPETLKRIDRSFQFLRYLEEMKFPEELEEIGIESFMYCTKLKDIQLPRGVKRLGDSAFNRCPLSEFTVTKSIESVGYQCFSENTVLKFEEGTKVIKEGVMTGESTYDGGDGYNYVGYKGYKDVVLPESVKIIEQNAFKCNKMMERIIIPKGIEIIGSEAFSDCEKLKRVDIRNCKRLREIGQGAFSRCEGLSSMSFKGCDSLKEIKRNVFYECSSLRAVHMGENSKVENICEGAFNNCNLLRNIDLYNCNKLKSIEKSAFENSGIQQLLFSEGIEVIGRMAFWACENLVDVVLPKSLKMIHDEAFVAERGNVLIEIDSSLSEESTRNELWGIEYRGIRPIFYVHKNSVGHKYCVENNLIYNIIENLEYTYNMVRGKRVSELSSSDIDKLKMMVTLHKDEKVKEIMTRRFVGSAKELLLIYNYIKSSKNNQESMADLIIVGDRLELKGYTSEINNRIHGVYLPRYINHLVKNNFINNFKIVDKSKVVAIENMYRYTFFRSRYISKKNGKNMARVGLKLKCVRTNKIVEIVSYIETGLCETKDRDVLLASGLLSSIKDVSDIPNMIVVGIKDGQLIEDNI